MCVGVRVCVSERVCVFESVCVYFSFKRMHNASLVCFVVMQVNCRKRRSFSAV